MIHWGKLKTKLVTEPRQDRDKPSFSSVVQKAVANKDRVKDLNPNIYKATPLVAALNFGNGNHEEMELDSPYSMVDSPQPVERAQTPAKEPLPEAIKPKPSLKNSNFRDTVKLAVAKKSPGSIKVEKPKANAFRDNVKLAVARQSSKSALVNPKKEEFPKNSRCLNTSNSTQTNSMASANGPGRSALMKVMVNRYMTKHGLENEPASSRCPAEMCYKESIPIESVYRVNIDVQFVTPSIICS